MSSTITDILSAITDPSLSAAKSELIDLVSTAQGDSQAFIQSNANQLQEWLDDVKSQQMSQEEFDELVAAQKIVAEDFVLRQGEETQERTEQLTVHILELAAEKIVPVLIVAAL
jgi:hypothetical protein